MLPKVQKNVTTVTAGQVGSDMSSIRQEGLGSNNSISLRPTTLTGVKNIHSQVLTLLHLELGS